ncbi:MAG: apolipoprotein N-acyltransferase [Bdellovibrionota bacterium]
MLSKLLLNKNFIYTLISALSIGIAWLFPDTFICVLLGFTSAFFYILLLKNDALISYYFLLGIILNSLGFYWLFNTIHDFGQFNIFLSILGFLIFLVLSSLQFIFPPIIYKYLKRSKFLNSLSLPSTLSFIFVESFCPKIFPWYYGHTTLYFKSLSLNASIGGVLMLSFFMFWISEYIIDLYIYISKKSRDKLLEDKLLEDKLREDKLLEDKILEDNIIKNKTIGYKKRPLFIAPIFFIALLINGNFILRDKKDFPKTNITLVQAIPTTEFAAQMQIIKADVFKYYNLTKEHIKNKSHTLIIWPESVITNLVHENIRNVKNNYKLPFFGDNYPLITGALSYNDKKEFFNSIFFVGKYGQVSAPYHKQILIPFGEYIPFAKYLPFLKKITKLEGFFNKGKTVRVYAYRDNNGNLVKVSPFVCYEELVPRISRDATKKGANLLVGLSNDGWFGKGVALHQHNMISSFRAIENNKFLIRSTHTGLSAIIDNNGYKVLEFPIYSDFVASFDVPLIEGKTFYSKIGDIPLNILNFFTIFYLVSCVALSVFRHFSQ